MSDPRVEATQYTVSVMPENSTDRHLFDLTVELRGPGQWAVCHMRKCLGTDGQWDYEPLPSERDDKWKAGHRFDLNQALILAQQAAPEMRVNGMTPQQCIAWEEAHPRD